MPRLGEQIDPKAADELARLAKRIAKLREQIEPLEVERNAIMRKQRERGVAVRVIGQAAGITGGRVDQLTRPD